MRRLAIIPARGGSKRIPQKNIVPFNGRPMLAWTVQAAIDSRCFDKILVSTDDLRIAEAGLAAGADVPFMRLENGDDHSPVSAASIGALAQAEAYWGTRFDQIVQLMPNCPLRSGKDISDAVENFEASGIAFQISCFRFGWMNPWWAVRLDGAGRPERLFPEHSASRSQDLDSLYCPTGAIWIARRDELLEARTFYGPKHCYFPMAWESAVDIDDMEDFRMALLVAKFRAQLE